MSELLTRVPSSLAYLLTLGASGPLAAGPVQITLYLIWVFTDKSYFIYLLLVSKLVQAVNVFHYRVFAVLFLVYSFTPLVSPSPLSSSVGLLHPLWPLFLRHVCSMALFLPNPHLGCFLLSSSPSWFLDLYQYNDDVRIRLRVGPVKICIVFLVGTSVISRIQFPS